jgi:integrase
MRACVNGINRRITIGPHTKVTRQGTSGKAQANAAMERLGTIVNFAMNKYEIDGKPLIQKNPVDRLSQIRAWHYISPRQNVVPEHKLPCFFKAVTSIRDNKVRDYLLLLLFTGLRRMEAATLKWEDVDLDGKVLTIHSDIAKNHHEHRLPLTDFLCKLFANRKNETRDSEYVFPGQGNRGHLVESDHVIEGIAKKCGWKFTAHDLRRTFLTNAEILEVPHYALKKLANHVSRRDVTSSYIVVNVERLRVYMDRISAHFLRLMEADMSDLF